MFIQLELFFSGVRQEQDIYVRLIDSVTKQVIIDLLLIFNLMTFDIILND